MGKDGLSSASLAVLKQNRELEQKVARLEAAAAGRSSRRSTDSSRNEELRRMLRQAQELDLAFLVDSTSSMRRSIDEVKNLAPKIATGVKEAFPNLKLRVGFVPYRDYAEHDQDDAEKCDFTDSFEGPRSVFVSAVDRVKARGGADTPEDVFSGLERVATLRWSSKTRVLIHIGDAPCHGKEFHDLGDDSYPRGDTKGRDISKLLKALRHDCQIVYYLFCHINDTTKKMLTVFRERAPQGGWIQEEKLEEISSLLEVVVGASCKSIALSRRLVGGGPAVPKYRSLPCEIQIPKWNKIKPQKGVKFSYKLPATLNDLFKIVDEEESLEIEQKPASGVQIAPNPFSDEGTMRWPYHALSYRGMWKPTRKVVVKRFKELDGELASKVHTMEAYCEQMEVQTIAAFLAEHFNQELKKLSAHLHYKTVEFTAVSVLQMGLSTYYNMEKLLEGRWIRYTNNVDYVNTKDYAATLHAFSHWTYQRSKGLLMVTDLQGVQVEGSNGKNVFKLCDPAVHCRHVYRYARTKTNWSTAGMDSFFETHLCNNICRSLKLTPKSTSFTLMGTVIS